MPKRMMRRATAAVVVLALVGTGCGDDEDDAAPDDREETGSDESAGAEVDAADLEAVATTYADLVFAGHSDATAGVEDLGTAIEAFVAAPDDLAAAVEDAGELKVVLSTEVASVLGVTIGFSDADGDS